MTITLSEPVFNVSSWAEPQGKRHALGLSACFGATFGQNRKKCPDCGHIAVYYEFTVTAQLELGTLSLFTVQGEGTS